MAVTNQNSEGFRSQRKNKMDSLDIWRTHYNGCLWNSFIINSTLWNKWLNLSGKYLEIGPYSSVIRFYHDAPNNGSPQSLIKQDQYHKNEKESEQEMKEFA